MSDLSGSVMAVDYPLSMSDEPFQRPGSEPMVDVAPSNTPAAVWQADTEPIVLTPPLEPLPPHSPSGRTHRGSGARNGLVIGLAGLLAGLAFGALFIDPPEVTPLAITRDAFPREVFGQQRDDYLKPNVEVLDAQLKDQVEGYRFAYGGDGAKFGYGKYALTIVNGRMSTVLPTASGADDWETPWVVSLRSSTTRCASENPTQDEPPPLDLTEILDDDSKDVFYWLERGRTEAATECVLLDENRNLSLRLEGSGWVENNLKTAGTMRDELEQIHAELID